MHGSLPQYCRLTGISKTLQELLSEMRKHKLVYNSHILFSRSPHAELTNYTRYLTYTVPTIQRQTCFMIFPHPPVETKAQRGSVTCLRTHSKQQKGLMATQSTRCPLVCSRATHCLWVPVRSCPIDCFCSRSPLQKVWLDAFLGEGGPGIDHHSYRVSGLSTCPLGGSWNTAGKCT